MLFVLSSVPSNSSVRVVRACLALFGAPADDAARFRLFDCRGAFSVAFSRTDVPKSDVNTFYGINTNQTYFFLHF